MSEKKPYWQNYWYDLRFRDAHTPAFEPLGPGEPLQVSNQWLATRSLDEFADWILEQGVDELGDSLRGELQVLVYTEAAPGPNTAPVLTRTVKLERR